MACIRRIRLHAPNCRLLVIYLSKKDETLRWPGWLAVADPGYPNGGCQGRGAAGAEVLAPQARGSRRRRRRGRWGVGRGCLPPQWRRGQGGGCAPSQDNFLIFHLKKSEFQCIMGSILLQFSCPFNSKKSAFWLPELANESTACKERANGKTTVGNNICMK